METISREAGMALRDGINKLFGWNKTTQTTVASDTSTPAPSIIADDVYERMKADRERSTVVKTCITMYDTDTRVKKAHRFYARDIVRAGFLVKTKDAEAKAIADALQKRLELNQVLEDTVRETSREGDTFYEVVVNEDFDISELSRKPTLQMRRNSNSRDTFDNAMRAYWMSPATWNAEPPKDALWFADWQIIHARWDHEKNKRYGTPMFAPATGAFKKVQEGELNVAVRRKQGGAMMRQHVVEGSDADLKKYKEDNAKVLGTLAAVIDIFSNKPSSLNIHQGDGSIDKIGDITHHVATMMAASDVPMELIAYGDGLNRDILGEKKEQYEETLSQGREWLTSQIIQPLLKRQWLLKGILPENVKYEIVWRTAKVLTPTDLRDLADALSRYKLLGVKDEIIQAIAALYLRNVDEDILNADGFDVTQFANNLKGVSV
jgi:hypothetical protein